MQNRIITPIAFIIGLLALAVGLDVYISNVHQYNTTSKPEIRGLLWPSPKRITPFSTTDHEGKVFGLEQMLGKWSFLFFGYTHCPDVCPITLSVLDHVQRRLVNKDHIDNVQIIFVSVDPERDTPELLATYVSYFNHEFIGLGGTMEQIANFTQQIGIAYIHGEETTPGEYAVDHTASVFLVDPAGRLIAIFSAPQQADDMTNRFLAIRHFIDAQG